MVISGWNKEFLSYDEYGTLCDQLVDVLIDEEPYDLIFAIPRGGYPIATHVCHALEIESKFLKSFDTEIMNVISLSDGMRILVVDDIIDTGKTIVEVRKLFSKRNVNVTIASLFVKPQACEEPDIFIRKTKQDDWIVFPWELDDEIPNRTITDRKDNIYDDSGRRIKKDQIPEEENI